MGRAGHQPTTGDDACEEVPCTSPASPLLPQPPGLQLLLALIWPCLVQRHKGHPQGTPALQLLSSFIQKAWVLGLPVPDLSFWTQGTEPRGK